MNLRPPGYEPDELPTALLRDIKFVVPVTGLEPVQYCYREILSLLCLPFHHTGNLSACVRIPYPLPSVKNIFSKSPIFFSSPLPPICIFRIFPVILVLFSQFCYTLSHNVIPPVPPHKPYRRILELLPGIRQIHRPCGYDSQDAPPPAEAGKRGLHVPGFAGGRRNPCLPTD